MNQNNTQNSNQNGNSNNQNPNRTTNIVIGVVVAVILLAIIINAAVRHNRAAATIPPATVEMAPTPDTTTTSASSSAMANAQQYQNTLTAYAGRVINLGAACEATPQFSTFPNGTQILLNNNSAIAQTVKFQNTTTLLRPYHYMLATLAANGTFPINCNEVINAGSVTVTAK